MSDHNPHYKHEPHDPESGQVESSALSPKPILAFLGVLFIATAFVFFVVKGLDVGFKKLDEMGRGLPVTEVKSDKRALPPSPEPLLQGAPGRDSTVTKDVPTDLPLEEMEKVRNEWNDKLTSYGWVDKQGGIARVPIDRAKRMIAEKGLPSLPAPTISEELQKAQTVREELGVAGSNAGRALSVQPPPQRPVEQPGQQTAPQSAPPRPAQPPQSQRQVQPTQH